MEGDPAAPQLSDPGGCTHYRRRCQIQAPCCQQFFSCHACHDELVSRTLTGCSHEMKGTTEGLAGRYLVEKVRCSCCNYVQPVAASCAQCGIDFAEYFCAECKLFTSPGASGVFHCAECGICRVGRAENFFHCQTVRNT